MITEAELTLEESERVRPLLDLYDDWSSVIWFHATRRTGSEAEAHTAVIDAFGAAAACRAFFEGPVSPIGRLLLLIDGDADSETSELPALAARS